MNEALWAFLGVAVTALLGFIGKLIVDRRAARVQEKAQKGSDFEKVVDGMADLIDYLQAQLEREREDCHREIQEVEARCLRRIQMMKETLDAARGTLNGG